jgi:hypothetical protein
MNEHELDLALGAIGASRTQVAAPRVLRESVRAVPAQTPQKRRWLPRIPQWRFQSMFNATKFVVAGAIVALFGGFLLSGVLTQPSEDRLPAVGASASAQAEPTGVVFAEPESVWDVEPDSTSTTAGLLPGVDLVTEEVEPGVFRVLSDGVRELSNVPVGAAADDELAFWDFLMSPNIAAGRASVWWFGPDGFFRLGDDQTHD